MFDVIVAPPSSNKELASVKEATTNDGCQSTSVDEETAKTFAKNGNSKYSQFSETSEPPPILNVTQAPQLAFLPTKFRKLVWIKRNDFVIVKCGDEKNEGKQQKSSDEKGGGGVGGGFRYVITNILYKDQVKHIKSKGLWPIDPYFANSLDTAGEKGPDRDDGDEEGSETEVACDNHGIVFEDTVEDEFMVNTNRLATLRVEDSSSEEDSD